MSNKKRGCTHEHREYKKHTTRKHNTKKKKIQQTKPPPTPLSRNQEIGNICGNRL